MTEFKNMSQDEIMKLEEAMYCVRESLSGLTDYIHGTPQIRARPANLKPVERIDTTSREEGNEA